MSIVPTSELFPDLAVAQPPPTCTSREMAQGLAIAKLIMHHAAEYDDYLAEAQQLVQEFRTEDYAEFLAAIA